MKATELIKRLQELVEEYGGHEVHVCDEDGNNGDLYIYPPCEYGEYTLLSYYTDG